MEKKQQILTTALKLFVQFGFHGTPTAKIAEDAKVANGTLFHHYKTKDDLVIGLYNSIKEELAASISDIAHENDFITPKFKNIFFHILEWALKNPDKFYYIRQFEISPHMAKIPAATKLAHANELQQLLIEGMKKKLLQPRPNELVLALYNSHVFGLYQYLTGSEFSPEEQKSIIFEGYEMIWDMLKYK